MLPHVRPLTRKERAAFRKAGLDPAFLDNTQSLSIAELSEQMVNWVLDNIYADYRLDDEPWPDLVKLVEDTYRLTYGMAEDVKNLSRSGTGTPQDVPNTANPVGQPGDRPLGHADV